MKRTAAFLANFGVAKGLIYFLPLVIAAMAIPETYAAMEFAFALAPLIAMFPGSPVLAAIPQLYLVRGDRNVRDLAAMVAAVTAALMLPAGLLLLLFAGPKPAMVAFAAACVAAQGAASVLSRTMSRRHLAAWADGIAALSMFLAAGLAWFVFGSWFDAQAAAIAWAIICVPLAFVLLQLSRSWRGPHARLRLRHAFAIGLPMVINGLFGMVVASGGRIAFGLFTQPWDLAAYAIGFRVAGLMLGVHQLMVTAFFARAYGARTRAFDRMAPFYLLAVAATGCVLCLFAPEMLPALGFKALTVDRQDALVSWLPLIALQVFLWISFATLEFRVNRARLAGRIIPVNAVVTLLAAGGLFLLDRAGLASPIHLVAAMALVTGLYVAVQFGALWLRGLVLPRTGMAIAAGGVPFLVLAVI